MERAVILFDRDCGFCRWATGRLLARDRGGRLRAVALQDAEADRLLGQMSAERKMASWHLVLPDGRVRSRGEAVAPLLGLLPGGAIPAAIAAAAPGVTERLYRWTAHNRDRLGRLLGAERCAVDPTAPSRADRA